MDRRIGRQGRLGKFDRQVRLNGLGRLDGLDRLDRCVRFDRVDRQVDRQTDIYIYNTVDRQWSSYRVIEFEQRSPQTQ